MYRSDEKLSPAPQQSSGSEGSLQKERENGNDYRKRAPALSPSPEKSPQMSESPPGARIAREKRRYSSLLHYSFFHLSICASHLMIYINVFFILMCAYYLLLLFASKRLSSPFESPAKRPKEKNARYGSSSPSRKPREQKLRHDSPKESEEE